MDYGNYENEELDNPPDNNPVQEKIYGAYADSEGAWVILSIRKTELLVRNIHSGQLKYIPVLY